jgi:hypothetical protein
MQTILFQNEHGRVMHKLYIIRMIICNKIYLCRLGRAKRNPTFQITRFFDA